MNHVFHRRPAHDDAVAAAGGGIAILDQARGRHLDAGGGAAVSSVGHGHPRAAGQVCFSSRSGAAMAAALELAAGSAGAMRAAA
jgi:adenosylmethionine-8-amino-7-oxononanoate aminotransferase